MKDVRKAGRRHGAGSFDKHVGQKIRDLRKERGLSQTIVGKAVGLSFQQIQKYENGANRVSAGQLWLLCEFFEVPIASMFEGVDKKMFKLIKAKR
jgi:transcriptional regulator with XRE-family HTH domain